ncbi:MAG: bifunctional 5,10-methylenetetrahydrofolate dehydrogenase/5,10-methenyltetrahydrofolate cyclohydrolase [Clostridia bacterium]|nr:bifunctional 5,10-methylenetetrahydrofolate dehydrogenase/5,10-methenyltetrahydrofolate cyclohydrolase [Clostridia bacterium]
MQLLKGSVAKARIESQVTDRLSAIRAKGESVRIALFRVGERGDDCGYERSILRACERFGIETEHTDFPEDVAEDTLYSALAAAAQRNDVDGILLFRPLPTPLRTERIRTAVPPEKDIDGALLEESCFTPCTPEACMHLLEAYGISPNGKRCVVIGRSPVVGKPLANLLRAAGGLVTVCHTQTVDVPKETREAELLFVACGKPRMVDRTYLSPRQIIIDVGFHPTENGFCGDVKAEDAEAIADAYTPVPGGVGSVTLSVLLLHAVQAHERKHV